MLHPHPAIPSSSTSPPVQLWNPWIVFACALLLLGALPADAGWGRGLWLRWVEPEPVASCYGDQAFDHDFAESIPDLMLNGDAWLTDGSLELTSGIPGQVGSAFLAEPIPFPISAQFETSFTFQIERQTRARGHGFAFVVQARSPYAIGRGGAQLGVGGMRRSLAIEFDTRQNRFDASANHVGVNVFGSPRSIRSERVPFDLADGALHGAWVEFQPQGQILSIFVAEDPQTKPERPLLMIAGPALPAWFSRDVYLGFAAANAKRAEQSHRIHAWQLGINYDCPCASDDACDDGLFCNGSEICASGLCEVLEPPCPDGECSEELETCSVERAPFASGSVLVDSEPQRVEFGEDFVSPVVVATVRSQAGQLPVVTRVSDVDAQSFRVRVQNPSGSSVSAREVFWFVAEEGAWELDGMRFEAQLVNAALTDGRDGWTGQTLTPLQSYAAPVVLGQVMTENDSRWSAFWSRGEVLGEPASADNIVVGKHVAEDPETQRLDEMLGVLVFEAGHYTGATFELEAGVGPATVEGVDNDPPYGYAFTQFFASSPTAAVLSATGVRGLGGGWAILWDQAFDVERVRMAMDEDQLNDAERRHAREAVSYLVISEPQAAAATSPARK